MENIFTNLFDNNLTNIETLTYFSLEISSILAIIINIILLFFTKRKDNINRFSDLFTILVLFSNFIILSTIQISNLLAFHEFNFDLLNNNIVLSSSAFSLKLVVALIFLCFTLCQYRIIRKCRNYAINLNIILFGIILVSNILIQANNFILAYFLFEALSFLIYKYASTMYSDKSDIFSIEFILISACATVLFILFYSAQLIIHDELQLKIINICMALSLMLKIGIFPLFNYSTNLRQQTNIPSIILQFLFLPFIGIVLFGKLLENISFQYSIFKDSLSLFLGICIISFCISAFQQKDLIKFSIQAGYGYFSFCLINQVLLSNEVDTSTLTISYLFVLLSFYSLITILKVSNKDKKITVKLMEGLAQTKPFLANLIIFNLLILSCIIPNDIFIQNIKIFSNLYVINSYGTFIILAFLFANCLIMFSSIKIILSCFNYKECANLNIKKGMIINYIIPTTILLLITIKIFL